MALNLKLSRTSINSIGTEMYISDVTGDYNVDTNPGGWGFPNLIREETNLFFKAYLNESSGKSEIEIMYYDPATVDNITLLPEKDGYIEVLAAAVSKTAPNSEGEWGTVDGQIVQMVDGEIVAKTVDDVFADLTYLNTVSFKTILLARIAIYRNRKNIDLIKLKQSKNDDRSHNRDIADLEEQFSFSRGLLEGARYLWCARNYIKAQLIIESFNEILYSNE